MVYLTFSEILLFLFMSGSAVQQAVQEPEAKAARQQSMNNLKEMMLAMHKYHDVHEAFPATHSVDNEGKPLLSWRVHVLPFIGQQALYEQFRLDEPWDGDNNRRLIPKMPEVYRSPASEADLGKTNYLGNASEQGILIPPQEGRQNRGKTPIGSRIADIDDGTSNTIAIVEVRDELAVIWTKPDDFRPSKEDPAKGLIGLQEGGFLAALCDGSVRFITENIDKGTLQALLTRDGLEFVRWP